MCFSWRISKLHSRQQQRTLYSLTTAWFEVSRVPNRSFVFRARLLTKSAHLLHPIGKNAPANTRNSSEISVAHGQGHASRTRPRVLTGPAFTRVGLSYGINHAADRDPPGSTVLREILAQSFLHRSQPTTRGPERDSMSFLRAVALLCGRNRLRSSIGENGASWIQLILRNLVCGVHSKSQENGDLRRVCPSYSRLYFCLRQLKDGHTIKSPNVVKTAALVRVQHKLFSLFFLPPCVINCLVFH